MDKVKGHSNGLPVSSFLHWCRHHCIHQRSGQSPEPQTRACGTTLGWIEKSVGGPFGTLGETLSELRLHPRPVMAVACSRAAQTVHGPRSRSGPAQANKSL